MSETTSGTYLRDDPRISLRSCGLPGAQMLDQLPRIERQFAHAANADGQIAHCPSIGQRHDRDRHGLRHAARGGFRHDADADLAFDQPAYGVEAAQLHAQPQRPADAHGFGGEKALDGAGAIEADEIVLEHVLETDLDALRQRMILRDHQHETVAAERIGFERPGIDRAGDDAEIGYSLRDEANDLVAQALFEIDTDARMFGEE